MKKVILFVLVIVTLASCSFESYTCHSYGQTNGHTKHGQKAQARYGKHRI